MTQNPPHPTPKISPRIAPQFSTPDNATAERVLAAQHYTPWLFRFCLTRPQGFRFRSGEFVMLALPSDSPIWRAYSIASPAWHDALEFYSIKVPDGPLTKDLQKIRPDDVVWVGKKPTGTLVADALLPGRRLWLIATGTGFAPFASLLRDPEIYDKFGQVLVTHTCREVAELAYSQSVLAATMGDPLVGEAAQGRLQMLHTTTQEDSAYTGRITAWIDSGRLLEHFATPPFTPDADRIMLCGSMAMLADMRRRIEALGFVEGSNARPGHFVVERAFVS